MALVNLGLMSFFPLVLQQFAAAQAIVQAIVVEETKEEPAAEAKPTPQGRLAIPSHIVDMSCRGGLHGCVRRREIHLAALADLHRKDD